MSKTRIETEKSTAERLHGRKEYGESYDDVINRILDEHGEMKEKIERLEEDG